MEQLSYLEKLEIWKPYQLETSTCIHISLGDLDVWVERYDMEWHVYTAYRSKSIESEGQASLPSIETIPKAQKPKTIEWKHYLVRNAPCLYPAPAIPDKPLVVRPDRFLVVLPGEAIQFFIFFPLWFRCMVGSNGRKVSPKLLFELPVYRMKMTWFGDTVSGELCYATETRLFNDFHSLPEHPLYAICPLRIRNESNTQLPFDKICLHTEVLSLYGGDNRIWTNASEVIFRGSDQETIVEPAKTPPSFEPRMQLLAPPRQVSEGWYLKRTFNLLKIITGF